MATSSSATSSLYSSTSSGPGPNQSNKTILTSKSNSKSSCKKAASSKLSRDRSKVKVFTPEMQDAQARGKDPFAEGGSGRSDGGRRGGDEDEEEEEERDRYGEELWGVTGNYERETYERRHKMTCGAFAMDNTEIIILQSMQRGESIPNTRHFFRKMMCGFFDPTDPDDGMMDFPEGEAKERLEQKAKPKARDWDRQGRDWGSGYVVHN